MCAKIIEAEITTLLIYSVNFFQTISMDFLDPRKTHRHKIRLIVGYVLVAIAIGLGTVILVYSAYGYGINTKTGEIVQNGLLFVDSKPGGADIFLNNKSIHQTTSARLVLPAKDYDLKLQKTGYRDWERKFILDEHTISRYVYPFLFPNKPVTASLKSYASLPTLFMQSPDRHWLLVKEPETEATKQIIFDEYDANDFTKPSIPIALPVSLLTKSAATTTKLTEVEWSTDNTHVLLRHDLPDGSFEFVIVDRSDPTKSINVNKVLGIDPAQVALKNKKTDQLYIYVQDGGTLRIADMGKPALGEPLIKNILAFKPYGNNLISYVTQVNMAAGKAQARIWDNGKTYPLFAFNTGDKYLLDIASYSGNTYYVAGSSADGRVNIYRDPLNDFQDPTRGRAVPIMALRAPAAAKVDFSDNARFIEVDGGQNFGVYDIETGDSYQYALSEPLTAPLNWMDGHRLIGNSNGNVFVMDYDSTNKQSLVPTSSDLGGFFSRDYNQLYTLAADPGTALISLERADMRAGTDLPKNPNTP
jgi:WD40 repeat protein